MKTVSGEGWSLEVPDVGWMIEGIGDERKIVEHPGDKAFLRAQDPDIHNDNQVFWTKEAAEEAYEAMMDPVGHATRRFKEGKLTELEFRGSVGDLVAEKVLRGGN